MVLTPQGLALFRQARLGWLQQPDMVTDKAQLSGSSSTGTIRTMAEASSPTGPAPPPDNAPLAHRLAARVVLLDPQDRVLLMRYDEGPPNGIHWATPGGGLNAGEDYRAAAIRE